MDSPSATEKRQTSPASHACYPNNAQCTAPAFDFLDLRAQFATIREEVLRPSPK